MNSKKKRLAPFIFKLIAKRSSFAGIATTIYIYAYIYMEERALSYIRLIASAYDPIVPIGA